jgi:hypothetical protein
MPLLYMKYGVVLPGRYARQLVEQEDALALRTRNRLHNPYALVALLPFELIRENHVLAGQNVAHWEEVVPTGNQHTYCWLY